MMIKIIKIGLLSTYVRQFAYEVREKILCDIDPNPFSYLNDNKMSTNESIRNLARSWYPLMLRVGAIGVFVSAIIAGSKIVISKTGKGRNEGIKSLLTKCIIASCIFGFVFFLGLVMQICSNLT